MKRKKASRQKVHDTVLECITITAMVTVVITAFTKDIWPNKSLAALLISSAWLFIFAAANGMFTCDNSNMVIKEDEDDETY